MLEMAESQHSDAQEILSFQACSWRVGTNADSAKPSRYNLISDWDDCVPEWHKSLIGPHFKDRRDCTSQCNHPLTAHETFTGTGNQKYYHTTAAQPWNNLLLPISATQMSRTPWDQATPIGSQMISMSFCSFPCHCCHETLGSVWSHVLGAPHWCLIGSAAGLLSPQLSMRTLKKQFWSWKQFHLHSSVTGYQKYY